MRTANEGENQEKGRAKGDEQGSMNRTALQLQEDKAVRCGGD